MIGQVLILIISQIKNLTWSLSEDKSQETMISLLFETAGLQRNGSFKLMCLIVFEIFSFHKCNKIHFRFSGAGAVCGEWYSSAPGPGPSPALALAPAPGAAAGQPQSSRQELSCEVHRPETTTQVPHKLSLAKYPSSISILANAIQSKVNMMTNLAWLVAGCVTAAASLTSPME